MRVLVIASDYPNVSERSLGIFILRRLQIMKQMGLEITILVPVTYCPRLFRLFKRWADYDHRRSLVQGPGIEAIAMPFFRPPGNWFNRWSGLSAYLSMIRFVFKLHCTQPF